MNTVITDIAGTLGVRSVSHKRFVRSFRILINICVRSHVRLHTNLSMAAKMCRLMTRIDCSVAKRRGVQSKCAVISLLRERVDWLALLGAARIRKFTHASDDGFSACAIAREPCKAIVYH
jgi:radical SAM superfamily enzyme YgiQ (UPF0313 family)